MPAAAAAATKQKHARKKKRISKHMQQQQRAGSVVTTAAAVVPDELQGVDVPFPDASMTKQKPPSGKVTKKKQQQLHTKDPTDVAHYLSAWKHRMAGTNWKFNKNTQSWIVRHMYEAEKLNKQVFELCLEYLDGMSDATKRRVVEQAKQRARRYKQYEATAASSAAKKVDDTFEKSKDDKKPPGTQVDVDDETRWNKLDDHSKRKEYKRARKILETLKQEE
jgi:hypothetical protein